MILTKNELALCLRARGIHDRLPAEEPSEPIEDTAKDDMKAHLLELDLLETVPETDGYRFSAYAEAIFDTVGAPDVWLEICHLATGIKRLLFLRDAFYVCVEEIEDTVMVDLLPSLPLFIGGYASMLKTLPKDCDEKEYNASETQLMICVHGMDEELTVEIDRNGVAKESTREETVIKTHTQESCTNRITDWLLNDLRRRKEGSK